MTLHLRKALQFPDDTMSPLTRQLATVISRMMAKSASDRYETPRELVSELEEIIEQAAGPPADAEQVNDEVSVGQSAPGEKPSQRVRRRRRRRRR